MTHTRYAFVKARWHADIVDRAYDGFSETIPASQIDVVDVPGAFESEGRGEGVLVGIIMNNYNLVNCAWYRKFNTNELYF